jgi:SAM-dependent methyltransferase
MSLCPEYDSFAEFYDHVLPYRERPDVPFFVDLARQSPGPVLEVGCGTGRVLVPCARAGATIVGLDLSPGMLAVCRRKLAREAPDVQARVRLVEGDMRDFDLGARFPLITLPFRSFQHLETPEDQRAALRVLARHLAPGGRMVLDLFNPSLPFLGDERWLVAPLAEPAVDLPDGRRMVRTMRMVSRDWFAQVQEIELSHRITWPDGRAEDHTGTARLRYTFRFEAEHLLAREGFTVEALYGDYDRSPYGAKYPGELIFVCRSVGG